MPGTATTRRKSFFNKRMGPLQRQLRQGEYGMFQFSPMFESDFVQISKQGGPIEIHNQEQIVTVGITSTSPILLIPNVLLLARPIIPSEDHISKFRAIFHHHPPVRFELTRLFPLRFVKISVHNSDKKQLRLKLVSGRTYYLQLCPQSNRPEDLFDAWVRIVQLLRPSSEISVKEQKQKNKKLKSHGVPPVPLLKLKSPPPPTESQCTLEKKMKKKNKKSTCPATQKPSAQADETKKNSDPADALSESSPVPGIELQPLNTEDIHEALCHPTPEDQEIAKNLEEEEEEEEEEETKIPNYKSHAGEKDSSKIKRKPDKKKHSSRSRSGHRGAARKPSKIISLIRSCSWGYHGKSKRSNKTQNKGKKYHAE